MGHSVDRLQQDVVQVLVHSVLCYLNTTEEQHLVFMFLDISNYLSIYLNSQGGLTGENFQIFLLKEAESRNEKNVFPPVLSEGGYRV